MAAYSEAAVACGPVQFMMPQDVLKRPLETLRAKYDYIFLDTAPNATLPTLAAYMSADYFILSALPDPFAIAGLNDAVRDIMDARASGNPGLGLLGVVVSGVDKRTRASCDWIDESRLDPLAPQPGSKRELTVWIWYPASVNKSSKQSDYIPADWRAALAKRQPPDANKIWHDPSLVDCHSFENTEISTEARTWPVVIMKPGVGTLALDYTTICEDLASHGYIVVASDSPGNTFIVIHKDGRVVPATSAASIRGTNATRILEIWLSDDRFLLDRLTDLNTHDPDKKFQGRLDLANVGVMGHSLGGATAAEFCRRDTRCKAGIDLDGQLFGASTETGINRPFMFLLADHSGTLTAEDQQIAVRIRSLYDHSGPGRQCVTLSDSGHFNFSDKCLFLNGSIPRRSDTIGKIDARRGLMISSACISAFFDVQLKGAEASLIKRLPLVYRKLTFEPDNH